MIWSHEVHHVKLNFPYYRGEIHTSIIFTLKYIYYFKTSVLVIGPQICSYIPIFFLILITILWLGLISNVHKQNFTKEASTLATMRKLTPILWPWIRYTILKFMLSIKFLFCDPVPPRFYRVGRGITLDQTYKHTENLPVWVISPVPKHSYRQGEMMSGVSGPKVFQHLPKGWNIIE